MQNNGFNFHNENRKEVLDQFGNLALVWVKKVMSCTHSNQVHESRYNLIDTCYELKKIKEKNSFSMKQLELVSNFLIKDNFWQQVSFSVFSLSNKKNGVSKIDLAIRSLKHRGQWYLH